MAAGIGFARAVGWRVLRDANRNSLETWLASKLDVGMSVRSRNAHLAALVNFGNWCVENDRLTVNPFARIAKANEKADPRRPRRALTEAEVNRLVLVTRWRPIAEYGWEVVHLAERAGKRSSWTRQPLEFSGLADAVRRGREALKGNPELIEKLDRQGMERALIVKTLVLTGLRKNELASLTVGQLVADGRLPCLFLNAADEKNRQGSTIPVRSDLADDLAAWAGGRDASQKLFDVPSQLVKILDRDLMTAGIPKRDDRGRTVDVHALRHTFGTLLSTSGASPRTAQAAMRHSSIDLTMNTYTDPKLLDVQGAVECLPKLDIANMLGVPIGGDVAPSCPKLAIPVIASTVADVSAATTKRGGRKGKSLGSQGLRAKASKSG